MTVVLVVDDDRDILDLIEMTLSGAGYTVVSASDGDQALAITEAGGIDIAVLDIMMPGVTGIDVARHLRDRQLAGVLRPRVLLVSALCGVFADAEITEAGADDFMTKPFRLKELVQRVGALEAVA